MLSQNSILSSIRKAPKLVENTFPTKNTQFVSYPSYNANITPRFNANGYGAFINYNPPSTKFLAVPNTPIPTQQQEQPQQHRKVNFKNPRKFDIHITIK